MTYTTYGTMTNEELLTLAFNQPEVNSLAFELALRLESSLDEIDDYDSDTENEDDLETILVLCDKPRRIGDD